MKMVDSGKFQQTDFMVLDYTMQDAKITIRMATEKRSAYITAGTTNFTRQ